MNRGIRIERRQIENGYRALCHVPAELSDAPGVKGACTDTGPWIEGVGTTADDALLALYQAIGRAYVHARLLDKEEP